MHYIVCALFCISISFSSFVCIIKYMSHISCILCTNYISHSSYGISYYFYIPHSSYGISCYVYISTFLIWHFLLCLYSILHAQHSPFFTQKTAQKTGYSNEYPVHSPVAMRSLQAPVYGRCGTVQSAPVPLQYRKRQLSLSAT